MDKKYDMQSIANCCGVKSLRDFKGSGRAVTGKKHLILLQQHIPY